MKKRIPQKPSRKPLAIAVLVLLALNIGAAALVKAEDAPILSLKRMAIAGQIGTDWRRDTNAATGFESKPAAKLVPIYRLYGPESGLARGSVALSFPVKWSFTTNHELEFGAYLSIILLDGADPK